MLQLYVAIFMKAPWLSLSASEMWIQLQIVFILVPRATGLAKYSANNVEFVLFK